MTFQKNIIDHISIALKKAINESYKNDENNFVPTVEKMEEWFNEFNQEFFKDVLPMIKLTVGNCGVHTWGYFYFERLYNSRTGKWLEDAKLNKCEIRLSNLYAGTEYNLKNTMLHEMVHYWIYYTYSYNPKQSHGAEFLKHASIINSKSTWHITPKDEYAENSVSAEGLRKYKNRITDTYVIVIYESFNQYGNWHAFRTDEKHVDDIVKTLKRWKDNGRFFRMKIDNPKFGLETHINRGGNTITYLPQVSGKDEKDVIDKIDKKYGILSSEEFFPKQDISKELYMAIVHKNDNYKVFKLEDPKLFKKVEDMYDKQHILELYKVTEYDEYFDAIRPLKTKAWIACDAYSYESLIKKLKAMFNIDLNKCEKIK